jgi:hypothetical protein
MHADMPWRGRYLRISACCGSSSERFASSPLLKLDRERLEILREKKGDKSPSSYPPSPYATRASSYSSLRPCPAHPPAPEGARDPASACSYRSETCTPTIPIGSSSLPSRTWRRTGSEVELRMPGVPGAGRELSPAAATRLRDAGGGPGKGRDPVSDLERFAWTSPGLAPKPRLNNRSSSPV